MRTRKAEKENLRLDIRIPRKMETLENEKTMIVCVCLLAQEIQILCVACWQRNLADEVN